MSLRRALWWLFVSFLTVFTVLVVGLLVLWMQAKPTSKVPMTVSANKKLPSVTLGGVAFHVRTFGNPEAPVIVVIHGGPGGDSRSLLSLKWLAKEGYRVVFYDQRGTGLSARVPAKQLTMDTSLEDLHQIVKWSGKGKPVGLLGHSWGGILATFYLTRHPKMVAAVAVIEPGILTTDELNSFIKKMQPSMSWASIKYIATHLLASTKVHQPDKDAGGDYFYAKMMFSPVGNPLKAYYCKGKPPKGAGDFWRIGSTAAQAIINNSKNKEGQYVLPSLDKLKAYKPEVLILAGACNSWIGPKRQRDHAKLFANATVQVIPNAGHMMHLTQPKLTRKALLQFFHRRGWRPHGKSSKIWVR